MLDAYRVIGAQTPCTLMREKPLPLSVTGQQATEPELQMLLRMSRVQVAPPPRMPLRRPPNQLLSTIETVWVRSLLTKEATSTILIAAIAGSHLVAAACRMIAGADIVDAGAFVANVVEVLSEWARWKVVGVGWPADVWRWDRVTAWRWLADIAGAVPAATAATTTTAATASPLMAVEASASVTAPTAAAAAAYSSQSQLIPHGR